MNNNIRISGNELKKSLRLVTLAASLGIPFFSITTGPALTGFLRQLGAGDFVYSLIMTVPVLGAVIQIFASYFLENMGRRKFLFILSGIIHRIVWIPIALIPFILPHNQGRVGIWLITIIIAVSGTANSIVGLTFNSWMGSLVPVEIKGRFFGRRAMIYTITGGIAALSCGFLLDKIPGFPGFAVVFIIAALLGLADISMFFWIKDPPFDIPEEKLPFMKLLKEPYTNKNYIKFALFVSLWYFGVNVAGPFFNVYTIEKLHMDFFTISLFTQAIANISTIISVRFWGNLSDKIGSKPTMFLCCCILFTLPFIWLFATPQNTWVVLLINFFSGIFWPGFELTALNQSIWLAPKKNRSIYLANYTLLVSLIGTAAAFLCGGAIMESSKKIMSHLDVNFLMGQKLNSFHLLFIISGIVRFLVFVFLFKSYSESNSQSIQVVLGDARKRIKSFIGMN